MSEDQSGGDVPPEPVNLHDIVAERMAERKLMAEQKRQRDLERIRNMKSADGIDPLQRFPKEIWAKIFKELDPEDRWNAWQVHPMFRDLFESHRIRDILLPQVMKINEFRGSVKKSFGSKLNEGLRYMSKTARNTFDGLIGDELIKTMHDRLYSLSDSCTFYTPQLVSLRLEKSRCRRLLSRLLESFDGTENSRQRFFPRALYISISYANLRRENPGEGEREELVNRFKDNITTLLERIGKQIWLLKFDMKFMEDGPLVSFADGYNMVHRWISLMPHLKWMEISIQSLLRIYRDDEDDSVDENDGDYNFLAAKRALRNSPFPRLNDLERLDFLDCHQPPDYCEYVNIYDAILQANQHVKILSFNEGDMHLYDYDHHDRPLMSPKLTKALCLTGYQPVLFDKLTKMERITPITNASWPLRYIRLGFRDECIDSVLRFLENFPTLETVKLARLESPGIGISDTGYLKLPNLVHFELAFDSPRIMYLENLHSFFSLQFLLHCKKLKTFYWGMNGFAYAEILRDHLKDKENEMQGQTLDFRGGLRFLYESNIWDVFPSLETVQVENRKAECRDECTHKYVRTARDQCTSIAEFSKIHRCSLNKKLDSCTMLVEV